MGLMPANDELRSGDAATIEAAADVLAGRSRRKGLEKLLPFLS
jgi:hypothetical protein